MTRREVNIAYAEATGSFIVLLAIAQQQGLFQKYGVDVRPTVIKGATVPRLTSEMPLGMIGEPAALLQAAEGTDLRIVASFSDIKLSGHLVARPEIRTPEELRGKRLGVRVVGAGLWISTILALEQLALDPTRDQITLVPVGSPIQILRALEHGEVDGALVPVAESPILRAKGFTVLLKDYPENISSFSGGLVACNRYLLDHPDVAENVLRALLEALAFSQSRQHKSAVMHAFATSLGIRDDDSAARTLRELRRRPYPASKALARMQRIMSIHDARVLSLTPDRLVEDRFVRKLDESGEMDALYAAYGVASAAT